MVTNFYKQTTYETCLAVALMHILDITTTRAKELAIWEAGWNFNFLLGQINYTCQKYNKKVKVFIENKKYFKELLKLKIENVTIENKNINQSFIESLTPDRMPILYIDNYILQKIVHAPHFVILEAIEDHHFIILDPWDGKRKKVHVNLIYQEVNSLRKHLRFSPVLIYENIY